MIRIAIDAMGGDCGSRVILEGALAAARDLPIGLTLVGRAAEVRAAMDRSRAGPALDVVVVDTDEVVDMGEPPVAALRRKPAASIKIAADLVATGRAAALFSAGSTGATVVAACTALKTIEGVDRPALATTIPTRRGVAVLIDTGANAICRPRHLVQFAVMGAVYARLALGIERPRVGLLSTGVEETKGNDLTREAYRLLGKAELDFVGNVDAHDLYSGPADVLVCDGFTGNIALKVSEGLAEMIGDLVGDELARQERSAGSLAATRVYRRLRRRIDYSEYGGAPLLGLTGLAVVGHGRSSARAVRKAVAMAYGFAAGDLVSSIGRQIATIGALHA
jgi:glycerol-3-phosphate acyltransferase PlsX